MKAILNTLPIVERSMDRERAPYFRKWRACPIKSLQPLEDGNFRLIPNPELTSVTTDELDVVISKAQLKQMVPADFMLDGGWVLFSGENPTDFFSGEDFDKKLRVVKSKKATITIINDGFIITNINKLIGKGKNKDNDNDFVEVTTEGGVRWKIPTSVFNTLNPSVGDVLLFDGMRQYNILHKNDAAALRLIWEDNASAETVAEATEEVDVLASESPAAV